ncbi:hypothetical protein ONZ45_g6356 [Pleurotus djamor]|nr:hypothetical protein ONZ45_g6356 [Pleurotus djamor]
MFSKLLNTFAITLTLALFVARTDGVDVNGFTDTVSCDSSFIGCADLPAGNCCAFFRPPFGFSMSWVGLPVGSQGEAFRNDTQSDVCIPSESIIKVFGPGDRCFNGGGLDRASTGNWLTTVQAKRSNADENKTAAVCTEPNVLGFTNEKGERTRIAIPKGQVQAVVDLFNKKDFKSLAAFKKL